MKFTVAITTNNNISRKEDKVDNSDTFEKNKDNINKFPVAKIIPVLLTSFQLNISHSIFHYYKTIKTYLITMKKNRSSYLYYLCIVHYLDSFLAF